MDEILEASCIEHYGRFQWSLAKNEYLKKTRWVSFYDMVDAISDDGLLSTELHSPIKYPHQKTMIVHYKGYVYSVPFLAMPDGNIFLKTLYPSRKYKKIFNSSL